MGAPTSLTVIGIIFLLFGVFVGWFAFPKMLHKKILEVRDYLQIITTINKKKDNNISIGFISIVFLR